LFIVLIVQNAISKYLFWNEVGVKYNFIAVNYLVYTNEVIGNIMESYPVFPLFSGLFIIAGTVTYFILKKSRNYIYSIPTFVEKIKISGLYFTLFGSHKKVENLQNIFSNELQSNGIYKFYKILPEKEAYALLG
jgi:hypothetical protein